MIAGFIIVILLALGFLYLSQYYGEDNAVPTENYLAGQKADNQ